jgi:SPP1 gp7 family putative phage head morphogenesis protein
MATKAQQQAKRVKARRSKQAATIQGVKPPKILMAKYSEGLVRFVDSFLVPFQKEAAELLEVSGQLDAPSPARIASIIEKFLGRSAGAAEKLQETLVRRMADGVERMSRETLREQIRGAIGVDISKVLRQEGARKAVTEAVVTNVDLIKTIPTQYFESVRASLTQGIASGADNFSVMSDILALGQSTRSRAKLIARDQIAKMNSDITKVQQSQAGINEYQWRTSLDGRVRDTHAANNTKVFRWDTPPTITGHPGQDIQCRCTARPILTGILEGL